MLPLSIYSTYSDKFQYSRYHRRRKTRRAFLVSLVLHAIATGIIGLSYIQWYQQMQPSEPLTSEAISVASLQRFHVNSTRKRSIPAKRRSTPTRSKTSPTLNQNVAKLTHSAPPTASSASIPVLRTDARLPMAETSLREQTTETPAWKTIATANAQTPTIAPKPKTIQGETALNTTTDNSPAPPIDRDARMGEALEGIAESVADSKTETAVDLVFLLDISGSMIDNIRAVGRQLNRMVSVFEEKGIDFTLGIVIFRYLEGDTIIHPQTRDSEKYKRLLTSHVVAAAGDERAHNAIIKAIRRVNFREGVNRRFILVTDEPSKGSYTLPEVLAQCFQNNITVDVIGINHTTHRALTTKTGGIWFPIPIQK